MNGVEMDWDKFIGETNSYEKKVILNIDDPDNWLKTVSAFANGKGGIIFFGIDDNDNLVGLKNVKKDSEKISELIKTKIEPLIYDFDLQILTDNDKNFIMLKIFEQYKTPYYVVKKNSKSAYIRVGNQTVSPESWQLNQLILKGSNTTFDGLETFVSLKNVSFSVLKGFYYQITKKELKDKDLISFNLVNPNTLLTNAGALLADQELIYQSRLFITRWNGLDKAHSKMEALDDDEFKGNIISILKETESFIKKNTKKLWKKEKLQRKEYPYYPKEAIREALVNALIHRDYSIVGSEIHIDIYDDRLEIHSPGGMYNGDFIQEQDIFQLSSVRRNPILADMFEKIGLM
ncbi:RNA-binding domain-containing protein [Mycoplasma mycoides]|nr:RNA-binding domain-containing protein [Mycoplasma mycoides]